MKFDGTDKDPVRVEIDSRTLARLMRLRVVGAADLKCLDQDSKRLVWKLCLDACVNKAPG